MNDAIIQKVANAIVNAKALITFITITGIIGSTHWSSSLQTHFDQMQSIYSTPLDLKCKDAIDFYNQSYQSHFNPLLLCISAYTDQQGNHALHIASQKNHHVIARSLLRLNETDPNIMNHAKETPLKLAIMNRSYQTIMTLLAHPKTNIFQCDQEGTTALQYAKNSKFKYVINILNNHYFYREAINAKPQDLDQLHEKYENPSIADIYVHLMLLIQEKPNAEDKYHILTRTIEMKADKIPANAMSSFMNRWLSYIIKRAIIRHIDDLELNPLPLTPVDTHTTNIYSPSHASHVSVIHSNASGSIKSVPKYGL